MNRYETTFTLTVSTRDLDELQAEQEFVRLQIMLLEKYAWLRYLEPSDNVECMEVR